MNDRAIQIISIYKTATKKTKYDFNSKEFSEIIESVRDCEITLVSIAGPSRMGKSFLLNYLIRYLENISHDSEESQLSQKLSGFDWKRGIKPTTQGLWMWSKPFLIKDSNKKTIAVLLMDTQGVYDEFTDLRDWSTIFGISLLTSSTFIYNEFNQLNENMFINFESYLNYGLLAAQADHYDDPPFQQLLFLIRDWQNAADFEYGTKGGDKFLKKKLKIRDHQSESAQRSRNIIKNCFNEISCFLMPEPGHKTRESKSFDGSVQQLSECFVEKMGELFSYLLSPETIKSKSICGMSTTGRELLEYFRAYVEKFNSDEIPKPTDLVEATAKAYDVIYIFKLKDIYLSDMKQVLDSKPFLTVNEMNDLNIKCCAKILNLFQQNKKTTNLELVLEISELINKELALGLELISNENDKKRDEFLKNLIDSCQQFYTNNLNDSLRSGFVAPEFFDQLSTALKSEARKQFFADKSGDDSIMPYVEMLSDVLEKREIVLKKENRNLYDEACESNTEAINCAFEYYSTQMKLLLNDNYFFDEKLLEKQEESIRENTISMFDGECIFGNNSFIIPFKEKLTNKMTEAYMVTIASNQANIETLRYNIDCCVSDSFKSYQKELENNFTNHIDFENKHKMLKENSNELFGTIFSQLNDSEFFTEYKNKLNEGIDNICDELRRLLDEKVDNFNFFCETKVEESFNLFIKNIKILAEEQELDNDEEINEIKCNILQDILIQYENVPKNDDYTAIETCILELSANEIDLLLMNKLSTVFSTNMSNALLTESYVSRKELQIIYSENKSNVLDTLNENIKSKNSDIIQNLINSLINIVESNYNQLYGQNEQKRDQIINHVISQCKIDYCGAVETKLNEWTSYQNFDDLSEQIKQSLHKYFNDICGKEDQLFDEYNERFNKALLEKENEFRIKNKENVLESKATNLNAVHEASMFYYQKLMSSAHIRSCPSIQLFEENELSVRGDTLTMFKDCCDKYGINEFSENLAEVLNKSKNQFKTQFQDELKLLTDSTAKALNDSSDYYAENMTRYSVSESIIAIADLAEKHNIIKNESFDRFKNNCTVTNENYINSQISELEIRINKYFEEIEKKLSDKNQCAVIVNDLKNSYLQQMHDIIDEKNGGLLDNEQIGDYHKLISFKLINELTTALEKIIDKEFVGKYECDLSKQFCNECDLSKQFCNECDRIIRNNSELIDIKNKSLQLEMREHLDDYRIRIINLKCKSGNNEDMINFETDRNVILDKFTKCNPFRNFELFKPHLSIFESEIEKIFNEIQFACTSNEDFLTRTQSESKLFNEQEIEKCFLKPVYENFENKTTENSIVIGIDLGTTNVCVAYYKHDSIDIIPNSFSSIKTPSILSFDENGVEFIGEIPNDKFISIRSIKRLIGRKYSDPEVHKFVDLLPFSIIESNNNNLKIQLNNDPDYYIYPETLYPEQIIGKILKHVKEHAENFLKSTVKGAVISVPAFFNDSQKEATKHAAILAGINVLKIISEPAATAFAYKIRKHHTQQSRNQLIFDMGGGFLDVAIVVTHKQSVEIKSIGGDINLGGDDIDQNLVLYCLNKFLKRNPNIKFSAQSKECIESITRLLEKCEQSKCLLQRNNCVNIIIENFYVNHDLNVKLTKEKFELINQTIFDKSLELVKSVLIDANMSTGDIDDIILVGRSTRIPRIYQMLTEMFDNKQLYIKLRKHSVAIGAAYYAARINGTVINPTISDISLTNVAPISLSIAHTFGLSYPIIRRNTKLPFTKTITVSTSEDNQTDISVKVYEGEDIRVFNNNLLGIYSMIGIPEAPVGVQLIDITFTINDEGIISATKADLVSNSTQFIVTEYKTGLTVHQINHSNDFLITNSTDL